MSDADLIVAAVLGAVFLAVAAYKLLKDGYDSYLGFMLAALGLGLGVVLVTAHFIIKYW